MREKMTSLICAAILVALLALTFWGFFSVFGKDARAECFDCLVLAADLTDKWPEGVKQKDDVITCQPAGWKWGKREFDDKKFKVVTICDVKPEEAKALSTDMEVKKRRYKITVVDDKPIFTDKTVMQAVTPADAAAALAVETEAKSAEATAETVEEPTK